MNLKIINLLKVIVVSLVITLNFQHFAKSQNFLVQTCSSKQFFNFSQFQTEESKN